MGIGIGVAIGIDVEMSADNDCSYDPDSDTETDSGNGTAVFMRRRVCLRRVDCFSQFMSSRLIRVYNAVIVAVGAGYWRNR